MDTCPICKNIKNVFYACADCWESNLYKEKIESTANQIKNLQEEIADCNNNVRGINRYVVQLEFELKNLQGRKCMRCNVRQTKRQNGLCDSCEEVTKNEH